MSEVHCNIANLFNFPSRWVIVPSLSSCQKDYLDILVKTLPFQVTKVDTITIYTITLFERIGFCILLAHISRFTVNVSFPLDCNFFEAGD